MSEYSLHPIANPLKVIAADILGVCALASAIDGIDSTFILWLAGMACDVEAAADMYLTTIAINGYLTL